MLITAKITGIKYKPFLIYDNKEYSFDDFDVNTMPSNCIVCCNNFQYSISKWVSPKRTRSYPYERVYNTLNGSRKITVIPIIKDEGIKGDRDFIQWDTISLMSLLDVYVILSYYESAEKHSSREDKITKQKMNNEYIKSKISEISNYHSSSLHWNLQEVEKTLPVIIDKTVSSYDRIGKQSGVTFHSANGIERFRTQIEAGMDTFMLTSRQKAEGAQNREYLTTQPKEVLTSMTKAKINIENYLGGLYYFTTDEIKIDDGEVFLIEAKHSQNAKLPSLGDIKDGLLKMILYCNLEEVSVDGNLYNSLPVLKLTSSKLAGYFDSADKNADLKSFMNNNEFNDRYTKLASLLYEECLVNNIRLMIESGVIK